MIPSDDRCGTGRDHELPLRKTKRYPRCRGLVIAQERTILFRPEHYGAPISLTDPTSRFGVQGSR
jgi:hypothetical protein